MQTNKKTLASTIFSPTMFEPEVFEDFRTNKCAIVIGGLIAKDGQAKTIADIAKRALQEPEDQIDFITQALKPIAEAGRTEEVADVIKTSVLPLLASQSRWSNLSNFDYALESVECFASLKDAGLVHCAIEHTLKTPSVCSNQLAKEFCDLAAKAGIALKITDAIRAELNAKAKPVTLIHNFDITARTSETLYCVAVACHFGEKVLAANFAAQANDLISHHPNLIGATFSDRRNDAAAGLERVGLGELAKVLRTDVPASDNVSLSVLASLTEPIV